MRDYYNLDYIAASRSFKALDTVTTWKPTRSRRVNLIDEILEAGKHDRIYYLAKYVRIFDELNITVWEMYKNGEIDRKEYERFHGDCLYLRGNYSYKLSHSDYDA